MSEEHISVNCPHCASEIHVVFDGSFAPKYKICDVCWKRFVFEKTRDGITTYKAGEIRGYSDPEYRETELSGGEEE